MQDVNIYIGTSIHGPARKEGGYIYILECIREGEPVTREGRGRLGEATENRLALTALSEALGRIRCPCEVRIYTSCRHVLDSMGNGWARQWQKDGWRTARGKEARNAELWAAVLDHLDRHLYTFTDRWHPYRAWMKEQLKDGG